MSQKVDKSAKVISQMFTSLAPRYNLMNDLMTGFIHRYTRKFAAELIGKESIVRVLDLASGTGDFAFLINSLMKSDTLIIGCDFSKGMLDIAYHRLISIRNEMKRKNLALVNSDINYLPFTDDIFDVSSMIYGLRNVHDPLSILVEINRITKRNGCLIIVESIVPHNPIIRFIVSFYFKNIVPKIASLFSSNIQAYDYYFKSVEQFKTPAELLKLLKKAKWKVVLINRILFGTVIIYQIFKQ